MISDIRFLSFRCGSRFGYNLPEQPPPQEFFRLLLQTRDRSDVADVRVEAKDFEDPDGWPSTDTIWVTTTANSGDVVNWLPGAVKPDDLISGFDASSTLIEVS